MDIGSRKANLLFNRNSPFDGKLSFVFLMVFRYTKGDKKYCFWGKQIYFVSQ